MGADILKENSIKMLSIRSLLFVGFILALFNNVIANERDGSLEQGRILSFPLLSHDQLLQRRRRELVVQGKRDLEGIGRNFPLHRSNLRHRHRWLRSNSNHTIAALYQGYGTHYVDLWVGTPSPQRQTVIVDTGSSITAFPCSECSDNCGTGYHTDTVFQHETSGTFAPLSCKVGSLTTICSLGSCETTPHKISHQESDDGLCKVSQSYMEGSSWAAFASKDWVYVGGPHDRPVIEENINASIVQQNEPVIKSIHSLDSMIQQEISIMEQKNTWSPNDFRFQLDFGCQTKITGLFITQLADGIMGVDNTPMSFWNQMYNSGVITSRMFSLCFSHAETVSRSGSDAGFMTLGGFDSRIHKSSISYAQNIEKSGWFTVFVRALYLKDKASQEIIQLDVDVSALNRGGIIVDSGTTDSYLNPAMKHSFRRVFKKLTDMEFGDRMILSSKNELESLPTLLVQLQAAQVSQNELNTIDPQNPTDVVIEIPPTNYLECSHSFSCQVILFMTENDGGVLGANSMTGYDVIFDPDHDRIGFATSDCQLESLSQVHA